MKRALVVTLFALLACTTGCPRKSTREAMIGSWELDKEATEKTNPLLAAVPRGIRYDFNADGTGAEGISAPPRKMTWKVAQEQGATLTVEVTVAGEKTPTVIEVTAVGGDQLKVNYPQGLGACQLKRRPAGAKEEIEESKPDDPQVVAALKKTKVNATTDPQGNVALVTFPYGVKRSDVLPALPLLAKLPSLRTAGLGDCRLTDADLAGLKDLKQVKVLMLNNNQVTDRGLQSLSGLTGLKDLFAGDNRGITDKGLEHLKGLTGLRLLGLDRTNVSDAGLALLKGMKELQTLKLWDTQVKGPGLAHLHGLPKLERLYVGVPVLEKATGADLKGLSHLEVIHVQGIAPPAIVNKVKAALPSCRVQ
jgi:hypothetical protein